MIEEIQISVGQTKKTKQFLLQYLEEDILSFLLTTDSDDRSDQNFK